MSEPTAGRRNLGTIAAYAGGAITAAGTLAAGVLFGQALIARLTIPGAEAPPPRCTGDYGKEYGHAAVLRLVVLGDSTAAGYGVHSRAETPGALLATWISDAARRPVRLTCPAVVGSLSAWLEAQVETALVDGADLAVILIGANDVTTRQNPEQAIGHLAAAVRMLRDAGAEVVVATCPDLGTIRPIRPPLRWLARRWSRQFAAAQTQAAVLAGGRTVSLGDLIGPRFDEAPETMFGSDRYHPSADGYRAAAEVILPAALAAIGLAPQVHRPPVPVAEAAAVAAEHPGTEVRPAASRGAAVAWVRQQAAGVRDRLTRAAAAQAATLAVPSLTGEVATPVD